MFSTIYLPLYYHYNDMINMVCGYKDIHGKFHDNKEDAIKASLSYSIMKETRAAWCRKYYPNESLVIQVNITPTDVAEYVANNIESIIDLYYDYNKEDEVQAEDVRIEF